MGEVVNIDQDQVAELIDQLTQQEGWTYVEDYIKGRINDCESKLIHSCGPDELDAVRSSREALRGVLLYVEGLKNPTE